MSNQIPKYIKGMKREIVKIDRELCDGCGVCIPNCHEGAIQMIDNKATLVSELMCDGLGACLGHCPLGAITIEEREADAYDEVATMKEIVKNGKNVAIAHLTHMKDHNEIEFLEQGIQYLKENKASIDFDVTEVIQKVHNSKTESNMNHEQESGCGGSCPGTQEMSFGHNDNLTMASPEAVNVKSELTHWPVQMHLINPMASYFQNSDLLLAADCVAFSLGNFHSAHLKGRSLGIACPKLDSNIDIYVDKLVSLINEAKINTITVMMMEVPCCGGLMQVVKMAIAQAQRKVPVKVITVGIQGDIVSEEWI